MTEPFPLTCWRYHADIRVEGLDRQNLPDCLQEETLGLFDVMPRATCMEAIRNGELSIRGSFASPYAAFAPDLAVISLYLFQILTGIEVAERHVAADRIDDVRAWKVIARRGEWVKMPLVVAQDELGLFHVDEDAPDLEVVRGRWAQYPGWFQDGMRLRWGGALDA